jgi:hypothetical protein
VFSGIAVRRGWCCGLCGWACGRFPACLPISCSMSSLCWKTRCGVAAVLHCAHNVDTCTAARIPDVPSRRRWRRHHLSPTAPRCRLLRRCRRACTLRG